MASKTPKHFLKAHRLISGRAKPKPGEHSKAEFKLLKDLRDIFKDPNIVGLGIAEKMTKGKRIGQLTLRFYVKKKKAGKSLRSQKMIPPVISIGNGKAIFTDVYEMKSRFRALVNKQQSPVESGFSVGIRTDVRAGTVGAVVSFNGDSYILSNAHVLRGTVGKTTISYPAKEDNDDQANPVGVLQHIVPLKSSGNRADAALAKINTGIVSIPTIPGASGVAAKDMRVIGTGRTTGTIRGVVRCTDFDGEVDVFGKILDFEDQVVCEGHADDGDSGALIREEGTGKILGLLFAASDDEFVFTPIATVREELGVDFSFG
jgi:hypothetical protein